LLEEKAAFQNENFGNNKIVITDPNRARYKGNGQQSCTGLDKYRPEMTPCFMIFRPGDMKFFFIIQKVLRCKGIPVTSRGGP
jgi:hypothetical protein